MKNTRNAATSTQSVSTVLIALPVSALIEPGVKTTAARTAIQTLLIENSFPVFESLLFVLFCPVNLSVQ
jgi:hypothetical protein